MFRGRIFPASRSAGRSKFYCEGVTPNKPVDALAGIIGVELDDPAEVAVAQFVLQECTSASTEARQNSRFKSRPRGANSACCPQNR